VQKTIYFVYLDFTDLCFFSWKNRETRFDEPNPKTVPNMLTICKALSDHVLVEKSLYGHDIYTNLKEATCNQYRSRTLLQLGFWHLLRCGVGPFIQVEVATVPQCMHSLRILLRDFPGPELPSLEVGETDWSL
jgi:hypothetical protein